MKKITVIIIVLLFFTSGCGPILRKFVRKKKVKKEPTVYATPRQYPLGDNKELYIDYYVYARGWMKELIAALKDKTSEKKILASSRGVVENLTNLRNFFEEQPQYQERLDFYINEFQEILTSFQENRVTLFHWDRYIYRVEKLKKDFEKDFKVSRIFG